MMKLIRAGLMSAVMVVMMCGGVFAEGTFIPQGSALVPVVTTYNCATNFWDSCIILSNITDDTIQCMITVYGDDGNIAPAIGLVYSGVDSGPWNLIAFGVDQFELPPNSTRWFQYSKRQQGRVGTSAGRAVIEWSSDNSMTRKALIAEKYVTGMSGTGNCFSHAVTINNGQPF